MVSLPALADWKLDTEIDKMDSSLTRSGYTFRDSSGKIVGGLSISKKGEKVNNLFFGLALPGVNGCSSRDCYGRIKIGDSEPRRIALIGATTSRVVAIFDKQVIQEIIEALGDGKKVMVGAPVFRSGEHIGEFFPEGFDKALADATFK